jgi:hypothetical protein
MMLYPHFKDNAALREGMRERAFEQIVAATISSTSSWQDALAEIACNSGAVLRAHPNWVQLLAARAGSPSMSTIGQWSFDEIFELVIRSLIDGIENLRRQPNQRRCPSGRNSKVILIIVKFPVLPDRSKEWLACSPLPPARTGQHLLRVVQER